MDAEFIAKFEKLAEDAAVTRKLCEEFTTDIEAIKLEVNKLRSELEDCKVEIAELKESQQMDRENQRKDKARMINDAQNSRKYNVIINGIPLNPQENLREVARVLAEKLEVQLENYHIRAIHRLPGNIQPPAIIMALNDIDVKHSLVRSSKQKKLSGATFGVEDLPIYIDEHLIRENVEILKEAKELKKLKKIVSVSCRDGKIAVREQEKGPWSRISDKSQLQKFTKKRNMDARSPQDTTSSAVPTDRENVKKFAIQSTGSRLAGSSQKPVPVTPTSSTSGKITAQQTANVFKPPKPKQ